MDGLAGIQPKVQSRKPTMHACGRVEALSKTASCRRSILSILDQTRKYWEVDYEMSIERSFYPIPTRTHDMYRHRLKNGERAEKEYPALVGQTSPVLRRLRTKQHRPAMCSCNAGAVSPCADKVLARSPWPRRPRLRTSCYAQDVAGQR